MKKMPCLLTISSEPRERDKHGCLLKCFIGTKLGIQKKKIVEPRSKPSIPFFFFFFYKKGNLNQKAPTASFLSRKAFPVYLYPGIPNKHIFSFIFTFCRVFPMWQSEPRTRKGIKFKKIMITWRWSWSLEIFLTQHQLLSQWGNPQET